MAKAYKIGIFDKEETFISSLKLLQEQEFIIHDVFTPYPVHEVFHLLKRKSRLPTVAYFLGLFGVIAILAFLYYTSVISWPLIYGGKPFNSFPSFIVVTIVLTIFTVTIGSLAFFSARSKLYPGRENTIFDDRATDDKFIIAVDTEEPRNINKRKIEDLLKTAGAIEILDKNYETVNE